MSSDTSQIRQTVVFSGHVQGVGFRYTAQGIAKRYDVSGYVQNLPDGRVEMIVEGTPANVTSFVDAVRQQMSDHIRTVQSDTSPATGQFTGFGVRH